jgi:isopentenyl diphosphate isomerase/L-lactate dehydrogenase-like FMN-dependent dehydrogenase
VTLRENVEGWRRWRLRPRVLVDVSEVSTATELLGGPLSMPVGVAPVAFQRLVDPEGEVAMARAAAEAGTLFTLSTIATARPSEVAAAVPEGRRWFQLYCFRDEGVTRALMEEAIDSGFEAIALTVDAPRAGRRERDFRTEFAVPADVRVPSLDAAIGGNRPVTVHEVFAQVDPALGWQAVADLASECSVPLLVKGIQTHEDTSLALDHGAAGVIVSNHGGRQLDCVSATADILPEVVEAVDGRATVLVDGGIRRGTDVLVALALGADAVLAGRAPLWGLAAGGAEGARRVLELLRSEIELALTLCGCASPAEMGRPHVRRASL